MADKERKEYDNSGILFKNDRKEQDTHPDYRGSAKINGVDYWMDSWIKEGAKGKFMTFRFRRKDERQKPATAAAPAAAPAKPAYEEPDDIPF